MRPAFGLGYTVAHKSVRTLTIFNEMRVYPLIKMNILEWRNNNKIYNLFLTNLQEIV